VSNTIDADPQRLWISDLTVMLISMN